MNKTTRVLVNSLSKLTFGILFLFFGSLHSQTIFFDDFGQTTVRKTTPYIPTNSYIFGDPSGSGDEQRISDDYYAVIDPVHIRDAWPINNYWYWTGPPPVGGSSTINNPATNDHTVGDTNGAVMVINAGVNLNYFYVRPVSLTNNTCYRLTYWLYLVNASSDISVDIRDVTNQNILETFTSNFSTTEDTWTEVTIDFKIPEGCSSSDVEIAIRNKYSEISGNDYYIDDIKLEQLSTCTAPEIGNCPTGSIIDTDGDGIVDSIDIDDDNDGILDTVEGIESLLIEGGFNGLATTNAGNNIGASISPWVLESGNNTNLVQVDGDGPNNYGNGGPEYDATGLAGNYFDVADAGGVIYQTFTLTEPSVVEYGGYFSARDNLTGEGEISIYSGTGSGGTQLSTSGTVTTENNTSWTPSSNTISLPPGTYSFVISMGNAFNFDEGFVIAKPDTDGDGIPNMLDLDSDNDGIPDNIEAQSTTGYIAPGGTVGENGLYSVYENDDSSNANGLGGTNGNGLTDTDNDSTPDYLDSDSDNDGASDRSEANLSLSGNYGTNGLDANYDVNDGYTDTNGTFDDSQTDNFPDLDGDVLTTGDVDYRDTDSSASDNDNDGIIDSLDIDDDNDGILDADEDGAYSANGDEDGDGIPNYKDTTDNGNGGDNSTTDYTDANGDGIADVYDNDGDGIPNHFDLDSDNDGIPDNIEAQSTTGYLPPSNNDADNDGLDDAYDTTPNGNSDGSGSLGINAVNTNNGTDALPDYLDTDSDGDGVSDTTEANLSLSGDYGSNGLDNNYDNGTGYTDVNGSFDDTQTDNFPDLDGDVSTTGDVDYRDTDSSFSDNDNDGIIDSIDIDDDNDGILDTEEGLSTCVGNLTYNLSGTIDGDRDRSTPTGVNRDFIFGDNYTFTLDFGVDTEIVIETTIGDRFANRTGTVTVGGVSENINTPANSFQTVTHTPTISDVYNINMVGNDMTITSIVVYDMFDNALAQFDFGTPTSPVQSGYIGINSNTTQTSTTYTCPPIDTDGDGIPNYFDLDSDNDGIPDNIEAQSTKDYIAPSGNDTDNDGLDDAYDSTPNGNSDGTGSLGIENPVNSDGTATNADTIPDYLDLDSDNDGIFDVVESGSPLLNNGSGVVLGTFGNNGLIDDIETGNTDNGYTDVNGAYDGTQTDNFPDLDGDVNSSIGDVDYRDTTIDLDTDKDGIPDSVDIDDDNDGILDTIEEASNNCSGTITSANFSIATDGGTTTDNIDLTSLGISIGDKVTISNVQAEGDLNGNDETFTLNVNNGEYISPSINTGIQCIDTAGFNPLASPINQIVTVIDIGAGVPGIRILADASAGVGTAGACNGAVMSYNIQIGCSSLDTDGDGIPNILDLDSDNDGIPDNIEAQSTKDYIAPSGNDSDFDGLDDAYDSTPNGNTDGTGSLGIDVVNTDNTPNTTATYSDSIPDYLDLDSDGDGLFDVVESGSGLANDGNGTVTGLVGANGLVDNVETGNTDNAYTDINGGFDDTQTDNFTDSDNDANFSVGDVDYRDTVVDIDTDNDGTPDSADIDDDNDGILDVDEYGAEVTCSLSYEFIGSIAGDRDRTTPEGINRDFVHGTDYGFKLTFSNPTEIIIKTTIGDDWDVRTGTVSVDGVSENISTTAGIFQTVTHTPATSSVYDINILGVNTAMAMTLTKIVIYDKFNNAIAKFDFGTSTSPVESGFIGVSSSIAQSSANYICTPRDTDGDGIPNQLDLDSDNDGIPDNIEAQSTKDYVAPTGNDSDNDGLDDAYDTTPNGDNDGTGSIGITVTNSDTDSTADFLDLDSDGDGLFDVDESGSGLANNGNGTVTGTVGTNGLADDIETGNADTGYTDVNGEYDNTQTDNFTDDDNDVLTIGDVDYRDALDTDNDGIPNNLDLDDDNDGILDTVENGNYLADGDEDGDGIPNYIDTDDNGDAGDSSTTSYTDSNSDGIPDVYDNDGDGVPNHLDLDADNDGIPDNIEAQSTTDYIAPTGNDTDNDGLDDAYDTTPNGNSDGTGSLGITVVNTNSDSDAIPDFLDTDSDGDGIFDIIESGSGLANDGNGTVTGNVGTNGLVDDIETGDTDTGYTDVNGEYDNTQTDNFTDDDNDVTTIGDVDYRDNTASGIPMITQVYQFNNEKWIEVTNISTTNSIGANLINIQLYEDKAGDQTNIIPDVTLTVTSALSPGQSIIIGNTSNSITNINSGAVSLTNDAITNIAGANDIITLSSSNGSTSWQNRYDVISEFSDKTSYVRIDETLVPNTTYTESEWVIFIDDNLDPYKLLGAGGAERHPHDPLISEIESSNAEANTQLGLHRINITTRTGNTWNNGYPDRSRFVMIDEDYNHTANRLSARKLTVNASRTLSVTDNLLIVTNNVVLNGDIRLINPGETSAAQLIQTHTSASLVAGTGKLLVDQNSTVPSKYRYNYMGSPVKNSENATNYTVASILKDGTTATNNTGIINTDIAKDINWISGYDGNTSDPISLAQYWIYTYAANGGTRSSWAQKFSNGTIPNTDGFIFKGPGRPQNYTFLGIPKDGVLSTSVGQAESYLVGNPYASALSVKKFIEDNTNSITGTLYFWEHAGEESSSEDSSTGHNFAGYIGGYATRTITMGVSAKAAAGGVIDVISEAENATISGGTIETVAYEQSNISVVTLNKINDSILFKNIASGLDTLRIRYKSDVNKIIRIKENSESKKDFELPATSGEFNIAEIEVCVVIGSNIVFQSLDTDAVQIDYFHLKDDGKTACAPSTGGSEITYTEPEPYIAIGQGFFVQGDDTNGGTIVFNNSQREYKLEEAGSSVFLKSSSKSSNSPTSNSILNLPVIKLGMDFKDTDDNNKYHRQIGISFSEFTSFEYDKGFDAETYDVGNTDIYWKFPYDDKKYVIAGVQQITNSLEVPIEITMGYSGEVILKVDEIKNVNNNIYITDKLTGVSYEILNNTATLFLEKGTYSDRFVLAFTDNDTLSTEDDIPNIFTKIYVDNKNKQLVISKKQDITINNVELYNILGKKVSSWNIKEQKTLYQLEMKKQISTGIYIVKTNSNKGKISKKIVVE